MRSVRVASDIVPVSELKAHAPDYLRRIAETGAPVVVTHNGKAAGVLLSPEAYDELVERARFVAAVEDGIADADAGRVRGHDQVVRAMRARFEKPR